MQDKQRGSADDLLTVKEAANYKGVGTRSVYKRIHDQQNPLPVVRTIPYMIRRADLDNWQVKSRYKKTSC